MGTFIKNLSEVGRNDIGEVGGKAANLGELLAAGLPVPPGFCITTEAYRAFIRHSGLAERISSQLEGADLSNAQAIEHCGARLRRLIMGGEIPRELREAILQAYQQLCRGHRRELPVAVRSSATAEDLSNLSFAGQHDTYLNVSAESDLLPSVKKCWASLWTDRAISYRQKHKADRSEVLMAVVVQELVSCSVSGIAFTSNPVSQGKNEVVINANWGLGESVALGRASPDEYIVDKKNLSIKRKSIAEKRVMTAPRAHGTGETAVAPEKRREQCLSHGQIKQLAAMGKRIEEYFRSPQDIEWGLYDGRFFVFQSRPITTLREPPPLPSVLWGGSTSQELFKDQLVFWSNWNTREAFPHPFTPLTWSHLIEIVGPGFFESLFGVTQRSPLYPYSAIVDLVYGRLYWNMNLIYGHPLWNPLFRRLIPQLDQEAGKLFKALLERRELQPAVLPISLPTRWLVVLKGAGILLRAPWFLTPEKLEKRCETYWKESCDFENTEMRGKSSLELLNQVVDFNAYTMRFWAPLLLASFTAFLAFAVIRYLIRKWPDIPPDKLLAGIPGNKTTEGALELYKLSRLPDSLRQMFVNQEIGETPSLLEESKEGRGFLQRLDRFMQLYGHRGPKEFDMGHPRWRDDPSFIFQMIKNYLQLDDRDITPLEHFEEMAQERERLTILVNKRLSQSILSRILPWRRWLFRTMLRRVHTYLPFRENPKYYAMKCYSGSRRILLEIGRRFCGEGYLESREEVWFLTLPELETLSRETHADRSAIRSLLQERKEEWQTNLSIDPPFIVRSDGRTFSYPVQESKDTSILKGAPASPGKATAKARIILDPEEECTFNKGDILVTVHTDPGWTPLFLTAKALVMEVGGVVSHGAIVAREYGIPAVVGVRDATKVISDGDEITVDGDRGIVLF